MTSCQQLKTDKQFSHLVKKHPCFSREAHFKYGRIHLPVSPSCNIQCKFCKRSFNKFEKRPGVSGGLLKPIDAVKVIEHALELCPDITVVGIAGPGDTLATTHALDTFEAVHEKFPHLDKCLSTNGLLLKENAERIVSAGVKTISVTVNAVDSSVLKNICSDIVYNGIRMTGEKAAEKLISAQLEGIEILANRNIVVKVNTVLIPGVNDECIEETARSVSYAGASIINIIPLIPQNEMENYPAPNCQELNAAREAAEKHLLVFKHCQQCRADACGIPGSGVDLAGVLYEQPLDTFSHG